jgi:hypothetical protein
MKKIIFYFSLFVSCASTVLAQNKHQKEDVWIDRFDFEANAHKHSNNANLKGEPWVSITDYTVEGESMLSKLYPVDDKEHGKVLELKYTLTQGKSKDNPFVAVVCAVQAANYPQHIVYVAYDFKGPEHTFLFNTSDVKDYNYFKKLVPASKEWTTVLIPLTDLQQAQNIGKPITFNPDALNGLEWLIQGKSGDTGSLILDNIRLVYTPIESKNYKD